MLVLSRKLKEKIRAGNVTFTFLGFEGNRIRVGIEAPDDVEILRGELVGHPAEPAGVRRARARRQKVLQIAKK